METSLPSNRKQHGNAYTPTSFSAELSALTPNANQICAVCALAYRRGPIAQLHALANAYAGPHEVATIYLGLFRPDSLGDADLGRTHEMFRKRLDRAGFKGAIVAGGMRLLGRRTGNAGSCMRKCSPLASTRTPGSSSRSLWRRAELRTPSTTSRRE